MGGSKEDQARQLGSPAEGSKQASTGVAPMEPHQQPPAVPIRWSSAAGQPRTTPAAPPAARVAPRCRWHCPPPSPLSRRSGHRPHPCWQGPRAAQCLQAVQAGRRNRAAGINHSACSRLLLRRSAHFNDSTACSLAGCAQRRRHNPHPRPTPVKHPPSPPARLLLPASTSARTDGSFQGPTSSIRLPLLLPAREGRARQQASCGLCDWACLMPGKLSSLHQVQPPHPLAPHTLTMRLPLPKPQPNTTATHLLGIRGCSPHPRT